jgi:hypothetical protein
MKLSLHGSNEKRQQNAAIDVLVECLRPDELNLLWLIANDADCTTTTQRLVQSMLIDRRLAGVVLVARVVTEDKFVALTLNDVKSDLEALKTIKRSGETLSRLLETKEMVWATKNANTYVSTSKELINQELMSIEAQPATPSKALGRFMVGNMFSVGRSSILRIAVGFIPGTGALIRGPIEQVLAGCLTRNLFRLVPDAMDGSADVHLQIASLEDCASNFFRQLADDANAQKKYVLVLTRDTDGVNTPAATALEQEMRSRGLNFEFAFVPLNGMRADAALECAVRNARQVFLTRESTKNAFAAVEEEVNEEQLDSQISSALQDIKNAKDL